MVFGRPVDDLFNRQVVIERDIEVFRVLLFYELFLSIHKFFEEVDSHKSRVWKVGPNINWKKLENFSLTLGFCSELLSCDGKIGLRDVLEAVHDLVVLSR